jgi:hypothetical protein
MQLVGGLLGVGLLRVLHPTVQHVPIDAEEPA